MSDIAAASGLAGSLPFSHSIETGKFSANLSSSSRKNIVKITVIRDISFQNKWHQINNTTISIISVYFSFFSEFQFFPPQNKIP